VISDEKFAERAKEFALVENTDKKYFTIEEYKEKIKANQTDKNDRLVALYTNHADVQYSYIAQAHDKGYDVLVMDSTIDNHYMQHLEYKGEKMVFKRVDADTMDKLIEKDVSSESVLNKEEEEQLKKYFLEVVTTPNATVELKALSPTDFPVLITKNEFMRRMQEMTRLSGGGNKMMDMDYFNLVVNTNHPLTSKLLKADENVRAEQIKHLYSLAMLSQGMLKGKELADFVKHSFGQLN
jgi:molecular chaperone HtpG